MFLGRKRRLILAVTCLCAFIYWSTTDSSSKLGLSRIWRSLDIKPGSTSVFSKVNTSGRCPKTPPINVLTSQFPSSEWRNIPIRYPVSFMRSLPSDSPRPLAKVQHQFEGDPKTPIYQQLKQFEVKRVFLRGWNSYRARAWMQDEVYPVSGGYSNRYGGWGATLIDNLDTLWIMGLKEQFYEAVDAAINVDFSREPLNGPYISVFETTIRVLGGLLSAYGLDDCRDHRILEKAIEVGDMLYAAFDTPDRMPVGRWSPQKALNNMEQPITAEDNILANLGSLSMEFTHLSQLTGDMRWYDAIQRVTDVLDEQQNRTRLPGMWPQRYFSQFMDLTKHSFFTLGAEADSTYEYLLKMHILLGGNSAAGQYEKMYKSAMDTAIRHLFFRPMVPDGSEVLFSGRVTVDEGKVYLQPESEHLSCFAGGMLALGGRIFENRTQIDVGRKLTEGCAWGYRTSPTGILPEVFQTVKCQKNDCKWEQSLWRGLASSRMPKGFVSSRDPHYFLRPEAIESVFYMYRITGDTKYQDVAWEMFQAIENQTSTEFGNSAIVDVFTQQSNKTDYMESFWMAETLKYLYLIFSDTGLISLDEFVLNTEAHPFRIPRKHEDSSSSSLRSSAPIET